MIARAATGFCAVLLAAAWGAPCGAQTVYESKDKSGATVFSDRPTPGAKPVDLQPPNVIQTPPLPKQAPQSAAAPGYSSLAITAPEAESTYRPNTGPLAVRASSKPSLRAKAGDRIRVKLDGTLLPGSYSSAKLSIGEKDWQAVASTDRQHQLQLQIVDRSGAVLIESAPVTFYEQRAIVRQKAR
jgi:hypothetical protein